MQGCTNGKKCHSRLHELGQGPPQWSINDFPTKSMVSKKMNYWKVFVQAWLFSFFSFVYINLLSFLPMFDCACSMTQWNKYELIKPKKSWNLEGDRHQLGAHLRGRGERNLARGQLHLQRQRERAGQLSRLPKFSLVHKLCAFLFIRTIS